MAGRWNRCGYSRVCSIFQVCKCFFSSLKHMWFPCYNADNYLFLLLTGNQMIIVASGC